MPANPQALDSLKSKGGRLAGFVRAHSDADANYNVPAPKQAVVPPRSDTPNAAAQFEPALTTREEIAKASKIQVPSKPRGQYPGPPAPRQSPLKSTKTSPVKSRPQPKPEVQPQPDAETLFIDEDATNRALFEGSQLGDDFMNSRLTTPHNELEDPYFYRHERPRPYQQPFQEQERVASPELGHEIVHHLRAQHRSSAKLQVVDGGRLAFHQSRDQLRDRSNVRDGFNNEPLQEKTRQRDQRSTHASPVKTSKDLPYRPVKIRPQKKEQRHNKQRVQDTSPYDNFSRHPANTHYTGVGDVIDLEDEEEPGEDNAHERTPKQPRRVQKKPQQTLMESAMPPPSRLFNQQQFLGKRTRASLDYDDKVLSQKTFADLLNEPFDLDPAQVGNDQGGDGNPLSNKLERFVHQSEDDQRAFFTSMPMNEWEESGDWLVDRFTDLMQRMKEARREKRKVVADFEGEAARREQAVHERSDALDRKMQKMRQDGMRVVGERQA